MQMKPRVIGEGTYGCVHKPSIQCRNRTKKVKGKISKAMLDEEALIELREYAKIARADKKADFYLGQPIKCKIRRSSENMNALQKCKNGDDMINHLEDYSLLVMNDGGIDIEEYADFYHIANNTEMNQRQISRFLIEFQNVFQGTKVFLKHDIIQHDVKPQNILYNETRHRINFIDFGLMQSYKKVMRTIRKSTYWLASRVHWSYPLEIRFLNWNKYMDYARMTETEKMQEYHKHITDLNEKNDTHFVNAIETLFSFILPNDEKCAFTKRYFTDLHNSLLYDIQPGGKNFDEFAKKVLNTIDIYGIGIAVLYFANKVSHILAPKLYADLLEFGYHLITPDFKNRYEIDEAISQYKKILHNNHIVKSKKGKWISSVQSEMNELGKRNFTLSRKIRDQNAATFTRSRYMNG